jgi:hypothetical protein
MQTLDLSGTSKKSDGPIKSLLWPTVDNAWDVDYLGHQGFWLCLIIGLFSLVSVLFSVSELPNPTAKAVTLILGVILFFVYFVGGMGVRQASWPAALSVFLLYVFDQAASGHLPSVITVIISAVLLSNVRATILASRWKPPTEDEDRPTRFNETFRDKLVDQLPPRAWPILKYPFYFLAFIVLFLLFSTFALHLLRPPQPAVNENAVPSATVSTSDSQ